MRSYDNLPGDPLREGVAEGSDPRESGHPVDHREAAALAVDRAVRNNAWMEMRVRPSADRDAREAMLYRWYRARLREPIPEMVAKWEPRIGVTVAEWRIRRMKTRWGTCNREAGRIWLNS